MQATVTAPLSDMQVRWTAVVVRARALGWSQNGLAARLHTERGHLSRVVRGHRLSMRLLERAERVLSVGERRRRS